jgi:hypothetical protein
VFRNVLAERPVVRKNALRNYPQTGAGSATAILWKAVENLVDSHAAEMVQPAGRLLLAGAPQQ